MPVPPRYWGSVSRYMEVRLFFNSQPDTSAFFCIFEGWGGGNGLGPSLALELAPAFGAQNVIPDVL